MDSISFRAAGYSVPGTRLRGAWLIAGRVAWVAIVLQVLVVSVVTIQSKSALLRQLCPMDTCVNGQLTNEALRGLQAVGLSLDSYALYIAVVSIVFRLIYLAVAAVIFARKSDDPVAMLVSLMLVTFGGATFLGDANALANSGPAIWLAAQVASFVGDVLIITFLCTFPNGRFVPRWTSWLVAGWSAFQVQEYFFPHVARSILGDDLRQTMYGVLFFGFIITSVLAQVYRYRRVSTYVERQQTKWVVFGITLGIGAFVAQILLLPLVPEWEQNGLSYMAFNTGIALSMMIVPISIGIAMLRSRLWDIDILINRTLVYGTLTVMLALTYIGIVAGLQGLLTALTRQRRNEVAVVVSTLAVAALFMPLRGRIQGFIDRRFYRRKYDASKTLNEFSVAVRDEVDLGSLTTHLLDVVEETMQPTHVSIWLRHPKGERYT
jgi:hypothetical protein